VKYSNMYKAISWWIYVRVTKCKCHVPTTGWTNSGAANWVLVIVFFFFFLFLGELFV